MVNITILGIEESVYIFTIQSLQKLSINISHKRLYQFLTILKPSISLPLYYTVHIKTLTEMAVTFSQLVYIQCKSHGRLRCFII